MAASYDISVRNEAPRYRVSIPRLNHNIRKILKALGWKKAGLSLLLVGDRRIRRLNRLHLKHDYPTDVIAFSQIEGRGLKTPLKTPFLGDLVISLDTATRQARRYGNSFSYELLFYVCHGILHLMGYDDRTAAQARRMERKQALILKKIGVLSQGE